MGVIQVFAIVGCGLYDLFCRFFLYVYYVVVVVVFVCVLFLIFVASLICSERRGNVRMWSF